MSKVIFRDLGLADYTTVWQRMQAFTDQRQDGQTDEIWFVQHPPVYTLGLNGHAEHLLHTGEIPVVKTDRGGQVTYHGPGQLIVYVLMDLQRRGWGVRKLVSGLEQTVIALLAGYGIDALARPDAPGVYVNGAKIAALGLRVRRGCSYHGLSINIDMDLGPFAGINPCGFAGLDSIQLRDLVPGSTVARVQDALPALLVAQLQYDDSEFL